MENRLKICAILAVRNELPYLKVLLPLLAAQDIDVVIVDNESTDGCRELYAAYMGAPVIRVETFPFRGCFSLTDQLAVKERVVNEIDHDWVVHHDADEILEHRHPGKNLRDAIEEADAAGYNVVNFDEFVFLPTPDSGHADGGDYTSTLRYYFFEPFGNRLNRAWKRTSKLLNMATGGHRLEGDDLSIAPTNHILRHYIVLNEEHARRKYLDRVHDEVDLKRGWMGNRLNINPEALLLPSDNDRLQVLDASDSKDFCRDEPYAKHFWQW